MVTLKRPLQEIMDVWPSENNERIRRFIGQIEEMKTMMYDEVETMRYNSTDLDMDFGIEIRENNDNQN